MSSLFRLERILLKLKETNTPKDITYHIKESPKAQMNISSGNYGIIIKGLNIAPKKSPQELYMSFTYNCSDIK